MFVGFGGEDFLHVRNAQFLYQVKTERIDYPIGTELNILIHDIGLDIQHRHGILMHHALIHHTLVLLDLRNLTNVHKLLLVKRVIQRHVQQLGLIRPP